AVVDRICARVVVAAEMVMVRGVDGDLVGQLGIAAAQDAEHVRRAGPLEAVAERDRRGHAEWHRLEIPRPRLLDERAEVEPRKRDETLGGVLGYPRFDLDARLVAGRELVLR